LKPPSPALPPKGEGSAVSSSIQYPAYPALSSLSSSPAPSILTPPFQALAFPLTRIDLIVQMLQ